MLVFRGFPKLRDELIYSRVDSRVVANFLNGINSLLEFGKVYVSDRLFVSIQPKRN